MNPHLIDRRLIEDYIPLDALNAIAAREKLHPRRYVALVHYWPARRPITACRAAVYATLAPGPDNDEEREEAASFVVKLAAYEPDSGIVSRAAAQIKKMHGGQAPKVLDLFGGGGGGFRSKPHASVVRVTRSNTTPSRT